MPGTLTFMPHLRLIDYTLIRSSRHGVLVRWQWHFSDSYHLAPGLRV